MGNNSSKANEHVFNADAPVRLSQSVINSLQSNTESDSTRAKTLELQVQTRVNSELQRIRDSQAKQLEDLASSLTTNPPADAPEETQRDPNTLFAHLSSPFYQDYSSQNGAAVMDSGRSHESVSKEVAELKQKLDSRKKLEKLNPEVEKAKESLVTCLRLNDRRPLDCWQEVESFKIEVGKLEKAFIQKAAR